MIQCVVFAVGPLPLMSFWRPPDVTHRMDETRPSPFFAVFCFRALYWTQIKEQKNGGGLGTRLPSRPGNACELQCTPDHLLRWMWMLGDGTVNKHYWEGKWTTAYVSIFCTWTVTVLEKMSIQYVLGITLCEYVINIQSWLYSMGSAYSFYTWVCLSQGCATG